ncbi:MAG: NAD(P)-dependent oxidoreductase [Chthoniobacter sp.]|nr:NAD(P)-dependent oxidoreductase [Chthoniobacter sp.]
MHRVLVTGATGFLGGAVARDLHQRGVKVLATGRNPAAGETLRRNGIEFQPCDLASDAVALRRMLESCSSVVHCAALSAPWGRPEAFSAANHVATQNVLAACDETGTVARIVHISSPSVAFEFKAQCALTECAPWNAPPANAYIASKRLAEKCALAAAGRGQNVIVLRPKALFGPGDTALLPRVVRVAQRSRFPLFGEGDPLMDLTWIGDAVTAVRLALDAPPERRGQIFNITSGDPQPRSRVLGTMLEACGLPVRFRRVPLGRALKIAAALEWISRTCTGGRWEPPVTRYSAGALGFEQTLDITAARVALGYQPVGDVLARLRETGDLWRRSHLSPRGRP